MWIDCFVQVSWGKTRKLIIAFVISKLGLCQFWQCWTCFKLGIVSHSRCWLAVFVDDPLSSPHRLFPVWSVWRWLKVKSVGQFWERTERKAEWENTCWTYWSTLLDFQVLSGWCLQWFLYGVELTLWAWRFLTLFHQQTGCLGVRGRVCWVIWADYHPNKGGPAAWEITLEK